MTAEELIETYYRRFNAGDWDGMTRLLSADVVHDINQGQRERGRPAFRRFLGRMAASYKERIGRISIMVDRSGKRVAAEYVVGGAYVTTDGRLPRAKGQTYRLPGGAFFEIRRGRIARVTNYYNLRLWLSLIGRK